MSELAALVMAANWPRYLAVLQQIAGRLGAEPAQVAATAPAGPDPIGPAVAATGLRAHRVTVEEAVKRRPRRPILAVRADDAQPVALLPAVGGWKVAGPEGTHRLSTGALDGLRPTGWVFHRRLPYDGVSGWGMLRFALRGARTLSAGVTAAGLAAAVLGFATPVGAIFVLGATLDHQIRRVVVVSAVLLGVLVIATAVGAVRDRGAAALQSHLQATAEPAIWDRMLSLPLPFFRAHPVRRLLGYANGIGQLRQLFGANGLDALLGALFASVALALLALVNVWLGVAAVALALVLLAVLGWLSFRQQRHDQEVYEGVDDVQALVYPALVGINEIHAYGAEPVVFDRWWHAFNRQKSADDAGLRYAEASSALIVGAQPLLLAVLIPLCWWTGAQASAFWVVSFAAMQLNLALSRLHQVMQAVVAVGPVHNRLRPIVRAHPERAPGTAVPAELTGLIELREVTFGYPGSREPILRDIDLRIWPGEFVAVVGPSGAGKSTLLRLLLGLDQPDQGQILFDGLDLAQLDVDAVRAQLGYVPQDAKALRGDVRSVILGGSAHQRDEVAWHAAELAGVAEDIRRLPMGLSTKVTDGASGFSGGQLQRLLIARALAKRPSVVLLDEATSALDNSTQDEVSDAIAGLGVTRVVVAHRLHTIRKADRIVLVDGGRIVETGRFDDLLAQGGAFSRLAAAGSAMSSPAPGRFRGTARVGVRRGTEHDAVMNTQGDT